MRTIRRSSHLRRYRNLPMDAVLALLYETGDEEQEFVVWRNRRERQAQ